MATGLATTGIVITRFLALRNKLQSFEEKLRTFEESLAVTDEDMSNLDRITQALTVQMYTFEDATLELLCDVLPATDIGAFMRDPGHRQWHESNIQINANEKLGSFAEKYWKICTYMQTALVDIEQDADRVPEMDTMSGQSEYLVAVRRLWEGKNAQVLIDLEERNRGLKETLDKIYDHEKSRKDKADRDLKTILDLITGSLSTEAETMLAEICLRIQQDEEDHYKQSRSAAGVINQSFQCRFVENATCHSGSTIPYDNLTLLRLRWAILHLPKPADFKPEKCCWSQCPTSVIFRSLTEFLTHVVTCEDVETAGFTHLSAEFPCLRALERAWYDNRVAWPTQSPLSEDRGIDIGSGLCWPSNYQKFTKRQVLPLEPYGIWGTRKFENSKLDAVTYQGVILVRKIMTWKSRSDLDACRQESTNLQHLNHFHIIQHFGSYEQSYSFAILMYPLCDYDLDAFMSECELEDGQDALTDSELRLNRLYLESFFPCLAQALKFIHIHTTRHADIKPTNILIKKRAPNANKGRHYHIYIADFGSSSRYSYVSQTTRFVAMTAKWCAPEIARDSDELGSTEVPTWGRPADVFSLGCVYAEMLTVLGGEDRTNFDLYRQGVISLAKEELPHVSRHSQSESFHSNLPRVYEWLQNLRRYEDTDVTPGRKCRGYWYRRGERVAFAPWKATFAETIDITESMLDRDQHTRPKIAEVARRLGVDDCCNREIVPLYASSA